MTKEPVSIRIAEGYDEAAAILERRGDFVEPGMAPRVAARTAEVFGAAITAREAVDRIVIAVRDRGDEAVREFTIAFDGAAPDQWEVPREEIEAAWEATSPELQAALQTSAARIRAFHERQPSVSWIHPEPLGTYGQIVRPLERVGLYAPAGTAPLPSTLLMTAVPARVAGVDEIIVASPPSAGGHVHQIILAAAKVAGVDRVFAIGGAQAIAAMAFGTESVPHVDKILGPGNLFVALAKQRVYGAVDIDQIAGPTETLVIADESADPMLVAADMIAQAEHDVVASATLLTTSRELAQLVEAQLTIQLADLERGEIARESLRRNGLIAIVESLEAAVSLSNAYAPEHLCLLVANPWDLVPLVRNAGGIFLGEQSAEALGDYTAGPSHVMPTGGTARFSSPVNLRDFQKVISLIGANERALNELGQATSALARAEGLTGHARAIEFRTSVESHRIP
ncbi:MAG TPA: histidinol dehydrogenase [Thermomicrobiales bacterium]|nr:histidinol dehydrogenase [Thermomicrobiales bacterium]